MTRRTLALAMAAVASALLAGCSDPGAAQGDPADSGQRTQIYLIDGNTVQYGDEFAPGTFEGVKGIISGGKPTDAFRERLLAVDPDLEDFLFSVEAYDAVMVTALAAVAAGSDSPKAIAKEMQAVSGPPGVSCSSFATCASASAQGEDVDYDGLSGPIDLNRTGSPSAASVGIFEYGADNLYQPIGTQTGRVDADPAPLPTQTVSGPVPEGDGRLVLGTLQPQTGDLSYIGPPTQAGIRVAVEEINAEGGVLGRDVELVVGDSGDGTPNIAPQETDKLLDQGVDAIIGTASSSVSLGILDKIVGAGILNVSPSVSSPEFDTFPDRGLFFRMMQSDVLQGGVLANTIANDGYTDIAIMVRQDAWGEGLAAAIEQTFTEAGGKVVATEFYAADSGGYTAEVNALRAADPDAIALVTFEEAKKIVPELVKAGLWMEQ